MASSGDVSALKIGVQNLNHCRKRPNLKFKRQNVLCHVQQRDPGYVVHSLAGSTLYGHPNDSISRLSVVLLHPKEHNLPFGMSLELCTSQDSPHSEHLASCQKEAYEVQFLMSGRGKLTRQDGSEDTLLPGDTVLMEHGAAIFQGLAAADAFTETEDDHGGSVLSPWAAASLGIYIPKVLVDGTPDVAVTGKAQIVAESLVNSSIWAGIQPVAQISEDLAREILLGANETARKALAALDSPLEKSGARNVTLLDRVLSWMNGAILSSKHTLAPLKRRLDELTTFQLPNQTNRLALVFDPFATPRVPFVFGIEIFEKNHKTKPHTHPNAHELFFILSGEGTAFCNEERFSVTAGDVVVFRPGSWHGIDNKALQRMYCLEIMLPDESFAEFVRTGKQTTLNVEDLCIIANVGCG